jgi:serine/threonine-protein kinase
MNPFASPAAALSDGRPITLLEELGRGRCGAVYRGLLESGWGLRRPVAVKVIAPAPEMDDDSAMRQLARIARRWACVRHPAIVELLEIDRMDALHEPGSGRVARSVLPIKVMELVEGESLAALLHVWRTEGRRVPVDLAVVVMLRAAEALGAALFTDDPDGSVTGLLHGDLSPRQILLSNQGDVKVGDFGEAVFAEETSHVRSRSRLAYLAPEVACGAPVSPRSDVFSLGVILHELLVGPRFAPGTTLADALRIVRDGHLHASILEPNLPRTLRQVIEHATARNPIDRHAHARALAFDLRREMLRLGLCDTRTSVRHAVVGWCEVRQGSSAEIHVEPPDDGSGERVSVRRSSDVVPREVSRQRTSR